VAEGAALEVWEAAFDGGIPHMVVLSNGAAGFVQIWPTVVLRGVLLLILVLVGGLGVVCTGLCPGSQFGHPSDTPSVSTTICW
jgi:hypothetical protein